jgi:hypothetical protein
MQVFSPFQCLAGHFFHVIKLDGAALLGQEFFVIVNCGGNYREDNLPRE